MTLDEAIKHCEEVIIENKRNARYYESLNICTKKALSNACKECAEEHQQLAEWLQELKELRNALDKIRADIRDWQIDIHDNEYDAEVHDFVFERIYEIIDKHKTESEE